ncbi:MAG TPA: hypothetical protein VH518_01335 [Tepidisphaeraceae bacterium]|jgi:hypothetical protein
MVQRTFKLVLLLLLSTLTLVPASSDTKVNLSAPGPQLARLRPEVRLRKLHLVRPDLIPYPLFFEVYC